MGITPVVFISGDAITEALFTAELDRVRTFYNANMVAGDIAATSIDHTHIYRPETYGFPKNGTECVTQDGYDRPSTALHDVVRATAQLGSGSLNIARMRGRRSIFPAVMGDDERVTVPDLVARIYIEASSLVEINAVWSATSQYNFAQPPAAGAIYPNNAGAFRLFTKPFGSASVVIPATLRRLNARYSSAGLVLNQQFDQFSAGGSVTLGAGIHDVWLEYSRDSANADVEQIILSNGHLKVEVHK